jgi:ABC-type transport system involved in multi-copper enzyme maturation permease subunit
MKLASIIRLEILYNAKKAYTYIFFGLLVFQSVWFSMGADKIVANNNVLLNAPAINYQNLAAMGLLLFAVTAIISAGALARDLESGAAHILYPAIIHEKRYFCGKYIGMLLVNFAVVLGYPLGILLFPLLGTGAPKQFGPAPLGQLLHGFFLFTMPNLIFLVVMFRKASAAYIGVLLIMICFLIAASVRSKSSFVLLVELLDPFGYCPVKHITDKMDMLELNTAYLPITTALLWNRMIWGAVSILLFGISFLKFKFKHFVAQTAKKPRQQKEPVCLAQEGPFQKDSGNAASVPAYGLRTCLMKSVEFAWLEIKSLFRSPPLIFYHNHSFLDVSGVQFPVDIRLLPDHLPPSPDLYHDEWQNFHDDHHGRDVANPLGRNFVQGSQCRRMAVNRCHAHAILGFCSVPLDDHGNYRTLHCFADFCGGACLPIDHGIYRYRMRRITSFPGSTGLNPSSPTA